MPWPLDLIGVTVRSVLGSSERAESEVESAEALFVPHELELKLDEALAEIRRASDSIDRHVEVLGTLSDSLPALTESVTHLTEQLGHVMAVTAPLAAAEREASRLERILRRRPQAAAGEPHEAPEPPEPPEAPAGEPDS